jgi:hypothetical protein
MELPVVGTACSPVQASTCLWLGNPSGHPEPLTRHQVCKRDEGAHFEHHVHNPCCGGLNDQERHSLNPERLGPKVFGSNMCDACFPKFFWVPNNVVKYDGKINASNWLEDYHLTCYAGGG